MPNLFINFTVMIYSLYFKTDFKKLKKFINIYLEGQASQNIFINSKKKNAGENKLEYRGVKL